MVQVNFGYSSHLNELYSRVQQAESKKLPKTAMKHLEELKEEALKEGESGLYIRALCKHILNKALILGKNPKDRVIILQKEITDAEDIYRPVLKSILAIWFWHYHDQNSYKFSGRTATKGLDEEDFTKWDSNKLFVQVRKLFEDSLVDSASLKTVSIHKYKGLIDYGSTNYIQTMYEFLLVETLKFYKVAYETGVKSEDAYEFESNSDAFGSLSSFLNYKANTTDHESLTLKSINLYQELLRHFQQTNNISAMIDFEIQRLNYVRSKCVGEKIDEVFENRLLEISKNYTDYSEVTLAFYELAKLTYDKKDYVTAMKFVSQGLNLFPESTGGHKLYNLKQQILAKEFRLNIDSTVDQFNRNFQVQYRNIDRLHFRIVEDQWKPYIEKEWGGLPDYIDDKDVKRLLQKPAVKEWSVDLDPGSEYLEQDVELAFAELDYGYYRILVSMDSGFANQENNKVLYAAFWYTDTTLMIKSGATSIDGLVLDSRDGKPLKNIDLEVYRRGNRGHYRYDRSLQTNEKGHFELTNPNSSYYIYAKSKQTGNVIFHNNVRKGYKNRRHRSQSISFYTDRAIYRPGQLIKFKGICLQRDPNLDTYETYTCSNVKVSFKDANYQTIITKSFDANEFGSFSGEFTAPKSGLMGAMRIQSSSPGGSKSIRVEEYKRPKFEITLNKPSEQMKLDSVVTMKGSAKTFSGVPLNNAKVKYRVYRTVNYPYWWRYARVNSGSTQMSHGKVLSDENGDFKIDFYAKPDLSVARDSDPSFTYRVEIDVLDDSGESHTKSESIRIGYLALEARLQLGDWLPAEDKIKMSISTTTLDQKGVSNQGKVYIYSLKQPDKVHRKPSRPNTRHLKKDESSKDLSDYNNFELDQIVLTLDFSTTDGQQSLDFRLSPGVYRAVLKTKDVFGGEVTAKESFLVFSQSANSFAAKVPAFYKLKSTTLKVGENLEGVFASGYDNASIYVAIYHKQERLSSYFSYDSNKHKISFPVTDQLKQGFSVHVIFVHENQIYHHENYINVTREEKKLDLSFHTFKSKIRPGAQETFSIKIKGLEPSDTGAYELLASMYDASLDAFTPHGYSDFSNMFYKDQMERAYSLNLYTKQFNTWINRISRSHKSVTHTYPSYPWEIKSSFSYLFPRILHRKMSRSFDSFGGAMHEKSSVMGLNMEVASAMPAPSGKMAKKSMSRKTTGAAVESIGEQARQEAPQDQDAPKMRTNLNETAFFYPHLISDDQGIVEFQFTAPDSLTKWKLMAMAHSKLMASGVSTQTLVTQKELMVEPNQPRFFRQGDQLEFRSKISNLSESDLGGDFSLRFFNALNDEEVTSSFVKESRVAFKLNAKQSKSFSHFLNIPDVTYPVIYRVVASTDKFSDGQEGMIPVLSSKILVRESKDLNIRGIQTKKVNFDKLLKSDDSSTLSHEKLVLQIASNPAWYAIQALPVLSKYPHESTDQVFHRYYANSLGRKIVNSDPKIERIFEQWKNTDALKSNLQKSQDLNSVNLDETPWVREAKSEEESKKRIALFFDKNTMDHELNDAMDTLRKRQGPNGLWPWFPGAKESEFISLGIVTGLARLDKMGVKVPRSVAIKALDALDAWIYEIYRDIVRLGNLKENNLSHLISSYLYGRSFYLSEKSIDAKYQPAIDYYLDQAQEYWPKLDSRMSEGQLALGTYRFNRPKVSEEILASLRERALHSDEMGMYFGDLDASYYWYRAPIESQTIMIELFSELGHNPQEVEDLKVWLLKQKQTQDWTTNRATADAVYALLLEGDDLLASDEIVQVKLGDEWVKPKTVEAGTGFYEVRFEPSSIDASLGAIEMVKSDKGVAWGGLHWQYFEEISKITPHGGPLSIQKNLFVEKMGKKGKFIVPIEKEDIKLGDTLVVRIQISSDRDLEFVHLKDMRASGTEPVDVLSTYKYQDGLGYYQSTKDLASHFYFDYLYKGTYVFEYRLKVYNNGQYESGMAEIECLYAPEFRAHSKSYKISTN